jgi:xylan 1,4-beta-xylosidase
MARPTPPPLRVSNPIIPGFFPDPSICRVGDDFYLVASSFEYFPGVPIFHTRDLVHFRLLGHVLGRKSQLELGQRPSSQGIYAPTIRHHRGRFYVITTHVGGGGNFLVTARRPEGPWSDPVWIDPEGIDPSLLFDERGVYLTRCGRGRDFEHPEIHQGTVDVETGKPSRLRSIWKGTGGPWVEAPHLYRIGSWYYLLTAEGGTAYDHSVVVARSRRPMGPFESCPHNPVLTHRNHPRHPFQATGHADLVELADGSWWCVLLGIRPQKGRYHHLGRETFLAKVNWGSDGWPRFGTRGLVPTSMRAPHLGDHAAPTRSLRDDFDSPKLRAEYNFVRNPNSRDWSLTARPGHLRLQGSRFSLSEMGPVSFVGRRQQHLAMRCRTLLDFSPARSNEEAGLAVRSDEDCHYLLRVRAGHPGLVIELVERLDGTSRVVRERKMRAGPAVLEIAATAREYQFRAGPPSRPSILGVLSTRPLSAECVSRPRRMCFTGVYLGMYATGNGERSKAPADFDWFEYQPTGP